MEPEFTPIADCALLVTFAEEITEQVHASIVALDHAISRLNPVGVVEVVPALVNLLVSFDPVVTDHVRLEAELRALLTTLEHSVKKATLRTVQVCYDEPYCRDLDAVAKACGLSKEAVINAHLAGDYKVLMYGFAPGYAYLGGVDERIQVPRKPAAVRDMPAGSVMIAGAQSLVTTLVMPTGWSIIGRSPTQILRDDAEGSFLFDVGDKVSFCRIDRDSCEALSRSTGHE